MKLLVAEDDDDLREVLSHILEQEGWEVVGAKDGRDALYQYHKSINEGEYFDALLLDVEMPRLNGFAVGVNVRNLEKFGDIPRAAHLYITGHDDVVPPEQLLDCLFADAYVRKPFHAEELTAEIKRLVQLNLRGGDGIPKETAPSRPNLPLT